MRAGKLRKRITIQTVTASQNAFGEPVKDWENATEVTVWGELVPLMSRAREQFATEGDQLTSHAPFQARLRYREGISVENSRLTCDGRIFEIQNVLDPEGRERETVVLCYEVQA